MLPTSPLNNVFDGAQSAPERGSKFPLRFSGGLAAADFKNSLFRQASVVVLFPSGGELFQYMKAV